MVNGLLRGCGVFLNEGAVVLEFLAPFVVVVDLPGPEFFFLVVKDPGREMP